MSNGIQRDELIGVIERFFRQFDSEEEAARHIAEKTGKKPETVTRAIYRIRKENTSGCVSALTADWLVSVGIGRPDILAELEITPEEDVSYLPKRKKRSPVPAGEPSKVCFGVFCQGQARPLKSAFNLRNSGELAGKPRSRCKECEAYDNRKYRDALRLHAPERYEQMLQRRRDEHGRPEGWNYDGMVPLSMVSFAINELCRLLNKREITIRLGVDRNTLWRWRSRSVKKVHREYAARILLLLQEVRQENKELRAA